MACDSLLAAYALVEGKINPELLLPFGQITWLHNLKSFFFKRGGFKEDLCQCSLTPNMCVNPVMVSQGRMATR